MVNSPHIDIDPLSEPELIALLRPAGDIIDMAPVGHLAP